MNDRPAVAIQGLTKRFKTGVTALAGIDLEVRPREFISLIGPSGCGKSTLLRIIGDLIEPSEGTVEVNGKTAHRARLDHDYGIVFQEAVLYDWRTVSKNIALPLELLRWGKAQRQQRVDELLRLVELEVQPREFVSLIGPSGCGKSTLLRIIGDLIEPSAGTVEVNGKSAHRARLDHDYGIVFQEAVLYDWRTVSKNIALPLELLRWSKEKRAQRVSELLGLVDRQLSLAQHPRGRGHGP